MRKALLLTTALLAGVTLASAQSPNNRQSEGAQQTPRNAQNQERGNQRQGEGQGHAQNQREERRNQQGNAQNQREERGNQRQGEAQQGQRQQGNAQNQREERGNQRGEAQQGQKQQGNAQNDGQERENQRQGRAQQGQRQQGNAQNQGQERENQRQGQAQQGQGQQGTVNLTSEQRTKVRQDIFGGSNVPRVDNVNFSVRVGTVVPNDVRIVEVPETLIAIHPEWRGDQYFVMRDDVIIVDHDHRIVAVMPVGSSAAQQGGSQSGSVSLSQSEIREVQMKLNQKGFNVGQPDGVMGPKTRDGLAQFQRQEGLQETGDIDSQTADALGISNAPSTTGSAPRNR